MRLDYQWILASLAVADQGSSRALNLGEFVKGQAQQKLPKSLVAHETELSDFADRCHDLCMKILRHFALGLKVFLISS